MEGSRAIRPGHFALLLVAIALFLVTVAVTSSVTKRMLPLRIASSLLLVVALYAASRQRWVLWLGCALTGVALAGSWSSMVIARSGLHEASLVATSIFLLLAAGAVLAVVVTDRNVSLETIAGAIGVYLLLGIFFAYVHQIILFAAPGAYRLPVDLVSATGARSEQTFLYYSFTTLTTLGYGEIHPVHPLAQLASNAEAVIGQLYIAVLVARLVTIYGGRGGGSSQPKRTP